MGLAELLTRILHEPVFPLKILDRTSSCSSSKPSEMRQASACTIFRAHFYYLIFLLLTEKGCRAIHVTFRVYHWCKKQWKRQGSDFGPTAFMDEAWRLARLLN